MPLLSRVLGRQRPHEADLLGPARNGPLEEGGVRQALLDSLLSDFP